MAKEKLQCREKTYVMRTSISQEVRGVEKKHILLTTSLFRHKKTLTSFNVNLLFLRGLNECPILQRSLVDGRLGAQVSQCAVHDLGEFITVLRPAVPQDISHTLRAGPSLSGVFFNEVHETDV